MKVNIKVLGMLAVGMLMMSCSTMMGHKMEAKKEITEKYMCNNELEFIVDYIPKGETVKVMVAGYEFEMIQKLSGSGSYYEGMNGDMKTSFHTNSREAIVNFGGGDISCKINTK